MSKKLEEKQRRRLADQMKRDQQRKAARRSNLITVGIAVVIIGAVAAFIVFERESATDAPEAPAGATAEEAGCDTIEELEEEGNEHVPAGQTVEYETSPPTSGDHWPPENVAEPGFYPDAVPSESLVHNMEHGQIVIWYDADANQETRDNLEQFADAANDPDSPGSGGGPIIAVPYDDVPEGKTLVMTAWTKSQACARYSLEAINDFRVEFQGRGPEQVVDIFTEDA